jgi:hypothetical protein
VKVFFANLKVSFACPGLPRSLLGDSIGMTF